MITWLNGQQKDCLPLPHRGLAYGDGLFESIRIEQGKTALLDRHLNRLTHSATALNFTDKNTLADLTSNTIGFINHLGDNASGVIKILLLRSQQGRGYGHVTDNSFDLIYEFYPAEVMGVGWQMNGINLGCCRSSVSVNPTLAGHKHLNRLDSVLATKECKDNGWDDGILFAEDRVVETTSANIFIIRKNKLSTPKIDQAGVKGVARELVLETAGHVFDSASEEDLYVKDLWSADFIFITNAVVIARPVSMLICDDKTKVVECQNGSFNALTNLLSGVLQQ